MLEGAGKLIFLMLLKTPSALGYAYKLGSFNIVMLFDPELFIQILEEDELLGFTVDFCFVLFCYKIFASFGKLCTVILNSY